MLVFSQWLLAAGAARLESLGKSITAVVIDTEKLDRHHLGRPLHRNALHKPYSVKQLVP
jgi:hypothetical protein